MLEFERISQALYYTLEYYESSRVVPHMLRFANPSKDKSTSNLLDTYYEVTMNWHKRMDDEIQQVIHTTNYNTQAYLFEHLKRWLQDYRIKQVHRDTVVLIAAQYNDRAETAFYKRIEEEEKEFRAHPNYQMAHLEEYQDPPPSDQSLIPFWRAMQSFTGKKINYKFRCVTEGPELIDFAYLRSYLTFVEGILGNFRNIVQFYVDLWDKGMVATSVDKTTETFLLPPPEISTLHDDQRKKVKVNLSVPQLAYIFKLLYEAKPDIFPGLSKADLFRFISANFETKATDSISEDSLNNHFSSPETKTGQFWAAYFKKMLEQARKE